ncbi:MAG: hypothetical protein M0D55_05855 [Elusimicrobiota bacterium]|nr:MAG: hypothetical protein M0D55_05855 [Elusimicrobiota bacterium]
MRRFAAPSLAATITVLAFLPSLSSGWTNFDDPMFLLGETGWRGLSVSNWTWAFSSRVGSVYQPLAWLTYGLDWTLWGMDPRGYHLQSVLWHAAAAALFCAAARELLKNEAGALLAALVFSLHPLRAESVSWIAERRDVVCGAFAAAAVLAYLRGSRPWTFTWLLLSLLAKGMTALLPAALLALDYYPLRRIGPKGEGLYSALREKLPLFALSAVFLLAGVGVQERIRWTWEQHGLLARLAQACYALAFYVRKTLWPSDLAPLYELRPPLDPSEPRFLLSAAAVAAAAWACWRLRRSRPWLAASAWWYAVLLAPVSGLAQFGPQLVADRYSYFTTWPLALLAGAALRSVTKGTGTFVTPSAASKIFAGFISLALIAALTAAGVMQQAVWRDSETLWARVLALDPASATAHGSVGVIRAGEGRLAEAEAEFRLAIAAFPGCVDRQIRLAALIDAGDIGPERRALARRVEIEPVCRKAYANVGAVRGQAGDLKAAREILKVAATIDPGDMGARLNLERAESALKLSERPRRMR